MTLVLFLLAHNTPLIYKKNIYKTPLQDMPYFVPSLNTV